jgi:hypothetical protein
MPVAEEKSSDIPNTVDTITSANRKAMRVHCDLYGPLKTSGNGKKVYLV